MTRFPKTVAALLVVVALILVACTPAAPSPTAAPPKPAPAAAQPVAAPTVAPAVPAKVEKISYAMAGITAGQWPIFVARQKGFYKKENIDLEPIVVTGAPGQLQALAANAAQIVGIQLQAVITAIETGSISARVIGNLNRSVPYVMVAQKEIKDIASLKGKRFGVSSVTGGEVALVKKALGSAGLKLDDVEMIAAGVPTARVVALRAGSLAGTIVVPPDDAALVADGYPKLMRLADLLGDFPFTSYTVTSDYAKANGDLLTRFVRASHQGAQWLFDPANKQESLKIIMEEAKMADVAAEAAYEFYVKSNALSKDMILTEKGMKAVLDLMVEIGDLKAPAPDYKKYLDLSYLEKATKP